MCFYDTLDVVVVVVVVVAAAAVAAAVVAAVAVAAAAIAAVAVAVAAAMTPLNDPLRTLKSYLMTRCSRCSQDQVNGLGLGSLF